MGISKIKARTTDVSGKHKVCAVKEILFPTPTSEVNLIKWAKP